MSNQDFRFTHDHEASDIIGGVGLGLPAALVVLDAVYASVSYNPSLSYTGASAVVQPKTYSAAGLVITTLQAQSAGVAGYTPTLDVDYVFWATNATGSNAWHGTYDRVDTNRALGNLLIADLTSSVVTGTDLVVTDAGGGVFSLVSTAGGFYHVGASILMRPD